MPGASGEASPAKKKAGKESTKKKPAKSGRAGSPARPAKAKGSGRKFQAVTLEVSQDLSSAVLHRLPPQGPPLDIDKFDQNRWLEEQLALTRQMQQLYTDDGGAACPYLGGSADDYFDDEDEGAWREEEPESWPGNLREQPTASSAGRPFASSAASAEDAGEGAEEGEGEEEDDEGEEGEGEDEGEEGEEADEASGSPAASKSSTLRSSERARRRAVAKRPAVARAAVDAALQKAASCVASHGAPTDSALFGDGELEPFSPFCIGRQPNAFPEFELTLSRPLPAADGGGSSSMQRGLFERI